MRTLKFQIYKQNPTNHSTVKRILVHQRRLPNTEIQKNENKNLSDKHIKEKHRALDALKA